MERRADGAFIIRPDEPLEDYPRVLTERLIHWARVAPDRALAAKRAPAAPWRFLTYAEALQKSAQPRAGASSTAAFRPNGRSRFFRTTISNICC